MASYIQLANMIDKGEKSPLYKMICEIELEFGAQTLHDATKAIMALIIENCKNQYTEQELVAFVQACHNVQRLMPGGELRSRQMLATLALLSGLS